MMFLINFAVFDCALDLLNQRVFAGWLGLVLLGIWNRKLIFVTVGNMDPFDRLLRAVDDWVKDQAICEPVVAQIGNCKYLPQNFPYVRFLTPNEYQAKFAEARFVIAHAGMGTIITAIELRKMLVIMPKLAFLGEQRNEHQLATLRHFQHHPRIRAALDEERLPGLLDEVLVSLSSGHNQESDRESDSEVDIISPSNLLLVRFVKDFVDNK